MFRTQQKKYKSRFLLHFREMYKIVAVKEIDYVFLDLKTVYFKLLDGSSIAVPYNPEELESSSTRNISSVSTDSTSSISIV